MKSFEQVQFSPQAFELFNLIDDLYNLSNLITRKTNLVKPTAKFAELILMFFITKSRLSIQASLTLLKNGFKLDAQSNLRTIFENIINIKYIFSKKNPEHFAYRYIEYDFVASKNDAETYMEFGLADNKDKIRERINKLKKVIKDKKKQYGDDFDSKSSWSGKRIVEMAKEAGLSQGFKTYYSLWSDFVHGRIKSSKDYTHLIDDKIQIFSKLDYNCEAELASICEFLIRINDIADELFDLKIEEQLKQYVNRFIEITNKYKK